MKRSETDTKTIALEKLETHTHFLFENRKEKAVKYWSRCIDRNAVKNCM